VRINSNQSLPEGQPTDRVGATGSATQSASTQAARLGASQTNSDQANLSSDALQLSNLSSTLANVPDVRQSRVTEVSQAMHNGSYSVSNQQIAQSMLRDFRMGGPPSQ
jgi:flagellar biosynthesis anti-sigma factor FlgM